MRLVIVPGRATFLNLSHYNDYTEKTFRRWFPTLPEDDPGNYHSFLVDVIAISFYGKWPKY